MGGYAEIAVRFTVGISKHRIFYYELFRIFYSKQNYKITETTDEIVITIFFSNISSAQSQNAIKVNHQIIDLCVQKFHNSK